MIPADGPQPLGKANLVGSIHRVNHRRHLLGQRPHAPGQQHPRRRAGKPVHQAVHIQVPPDTLRSGAVKRIRPGHQLAHGIPPQQHLQAPARLAILTLKIQQGPQITADLGTIQVKILLGHGRHKRRANIHLQIQVRLMLPAGVNQPELPACGRFPVRRRISNRLINRLHRHIEKRPEIILRQRKR